MALHTYFFGG